MYIDRNYTMFTEHRLKQINRELRQANASPRAKRLFRREFQSEPASTEPPKNISIALYRFFLLKHPSPPPYRPPKLSIVNCQFSIVKNHRRWYYQHLRALVYLYRLGFLTSSELHQLHRILKIMGSPF